MAKTTPEPVVTTWIPSAHDHSTPVVEVPVVEDVAASE